MIKHEKFVYIHIPKTGGNSVTKALIKAGIAKENTIVNHGAPSSKPAVPVLAFVRHPLDFYISYWYYRRQGLGGWHHHLDSRIIELPLDEYVRAAAGTATGIFLDLGRYVTFWGNFSNIERDLNIFLSRCGFDKVVEIARQNISAHRGREHVLSDETLSLVREKDAGLIDLYERTF